MISVEGEVPAMKFRMTICLAAAVVAGWATRTDGAQPAVDSAGAVQSSDGKVVLRRAMRGIVPDTVLAAKKQGFSVPDGSWYRSGSAEFVRGIVLSERALDRGYFRPAYIERVLEEHAQGVRNHRLLIWSLLCFEMWNRLFVDDELELV